MKKVYYLTFQETPDSGIFQTQVIDVVKSWKQDYDSKIDVKLISLLPIKKYKINKRIIKSELPDSIIIPQLPIPRMLFWKANFFSFFVVCLFLRPYTIIGRSIFATSLAISLKKIGLVKKVIFDSRGIITEETKEYGVYPTQIRKSIEVIEKKCLKKADYVMLITKQMVDYFELAFNYNKNNFFIIPCTLGLEYKKISFSFNNSNDTIRDRLGYLKEDCVLVYSGSNAGWQSFDLMLLKVREILTSIQSVKLLLLTKQNNLIDQLILDYPNRVKCLWVKSDEVYKYLNICDYGIMIREASKTNMVCSPTKFAEYLASGLPVIASRTMAITNFIKDNECGFIIDLHKPIGLNLKRVEESEKIRINALSALHFDKKSPLIRGKYNELFQVAVN